MFFYWFCLICGILFFCFFMSMRVKKSTVGAVIFKSMTSVFFILSALSAIRILLQKGIDAEFGLFVVGGLAFGMLGDLWLDFKYIYKEDGETYTDVGMYCFSFCHILYIGGSIRTFADNEKPLFMIIPVIIGVLLGFGAVLGQKFLKLDFGKQKKIAIFYTSLLMTSGLMNTSFAIMNGGKNITLDMLAVAGLLFIVSDYILSGTYWGQGKDKKVHIVVNHITYYLAQYLIASSLLFMQ